MPDDYPKAAGKHAVDSRALLAARRFDGAGYLAGYAVECVLKTVVEVEGSNPRPFGHDLSRLNRESLQLASVASVRTAKYAAPLRGTRLPVEWSPGLRYQPPGVVSEDQAKEWVTVAERLYEKVIVPMRLDGVI
ncbi:MAG: HEPN domain-containing protein [Bryobacteraceae bacterium]